MGYISKGDFSSNKQQQLEVTEKKPKLKALTDPNAAT